MPRLNRIKCAERLYHTLNDFRKYFYQDEIGFVIFYFQCRAGYERDALKKEKNTFRIKKVAVIVLVDCIGII